MKAFLKTAGCILLSITVIAYILFSLASWLMSPRRLTLLTESVLSRNIDGHVDVGRAELDVDDGLHCARIRLDDVVIVSHALRRAPADVRARLTAADDTLMRLSSLTASVDLGGLLHGEVRIGPVTVDSPQLNLVVADPELANFDILPRNEANSSRFIRWLSGLDDFRIESIDITGGLPSSYVSKVDGSRVTFTIPDFRIDGASAPDYRLDFSTVVTARTLDHYNLNPLRAAARSGVRWDYRRPNIVKFTGMKLALNDMAVDIESEVDFTADFRLNTLEFTVSDMDVNTVMGHLPPSLSRYCDGLRTDLGFTLNLALADTLTVSNLDRVPSARMRLDVPDCEVRFGDTRLSTARMKARAYFDGARPDASVVDVDELYLEGDGVTLGLDGSVTHPFSDPAITAHVRGDVVMEKLPAEVRRLSRARVDGRADIDAGVAMNLSDIAGGDYSRIILSGGMDVDDLAVTMPGHPLKALARRVKVGFGATSAYSDRERIAVDSLLALTLSVDTAVMLLPGNTVEFSSVLADVGSPVDARTHRPLAGRLGSLIRIGTFTYDAPDSVRVRIRDAEASAVLSPTAAAPVEPRLDLSLTARRFTTRGPGFGVAVSQPLVHVASRRHPDSIASRRLPLRGHINELDTIIARDAMDWNVATALQQILLQWDIAGTLTSSAGFVFVHDFPLRQRASAIDLRFNNDSVIVNSLRYTLGGSAFDITGNVGNMTRAFTSYRRSVPLTADLALSSGYVDINELMVTSLHRTVGSAGPDPDYTEEITETHHLHADTAAARPIIIPRNISASLALNADSVLYSDLMLKQLTGEILIDNSTVNIHDLHASSRAGDLDLCALYWAPDSSNLRLGMGLQLTQFDLGRTLRFIPALGRLLPALRGFSGTIDVDMAATTDLTPRMDLDMDSFKGALKLEGDSLALVDPERFRSLSRWLLLHDGRHIDIDHIDAEMVIDNRSVELFPFIFNIDRYRLGVMGSNNLDMDLDYHVSVLRSPVPFKFGINITGPSHHPKIRLGGAKIRPEMLRRFEIADSSRRSLVSEIRTVFDLGAMSRDALNLPPAPIVDIDEYTDSLSAHETMWMRREGWLPEADTATDSITGKDLPKPTHKHHFWIF